MHFEIKKFDFVTIAMLQKQYQLCGKFEENGIKKYFTLTCYYCSTVDGIGTNSMR